MTRSSLILLLPFMVIAATLVLVLLTIAGKRSHVRTLALTLTGMTCAFLAIIPASSELLLLRQVTPQLVVDDYALFCMIIVLGAAFAVAVLSYGYLETRTGRPEEFYVLLLLATLGSMVLTSSSHFASFVMGLETQTIPLYALIAYPLTGRKHIEASIKYLVLSAVAFSFLLFGMALIYARLGTMEFPEIAARLPAFQADPTLWTGTIMLVTGVGFKLAFVPFHMWTPDVYEGAPAPVTAFLATVAKGAVFALLLRYFADTTLLYETSLFTIFSIIAVVSMCFGNLLALLQDNVKRLLAYSSIAHFGYMMVAFLSAGTLRTGAVLFYLAQYFIATIGIFGVMSLMSREGRDADSIRDYQGLFSSRPWLAVVMTLMLLSLAGMPLTAGFMGKFLMLTTGIGSDLLLLATALVINSVVGLFYYLRVITAVLAPSPEHGPGGLARLPLADSLIVCILAFLVVWWGIFPDTLVAMILTMAGHA